MKIRQSKDSASVAQMLQSSLVHAVEAIRKISFKGIGAFFSPTIVIELGTSSSSVCVQQARVGLRSQMRCMTEPTVMAMERGRDVVVAMGDQAREMLGKQPRSIRVIRPMKNGVIAEHRVMRLFLQALLTKVLNGRVVFPPKAYVSVPVGASKIEREVIRGVVQALPARSVVLVDEPLAAAVGAGVPVLDASGSLVLHLGSGICESVLLSLGGVVSWRSERGGANDMDQVIIDAVRRSTDVAIGKATAEGLRHLVGAPGWLRSNEQIEVVARNAHTGALERVLIDPKSIQESLQGHYERFITMIREMFLEVPPELVADVVDKGVLVTGGLANTAGFSSFLSNALQVPVTIAEHPERVVLKGLESIAMEDRTR